VAMYNFLQGIIILSKYQQVAKHSEIYAEHDLIHTCFTVPEHDLSEEDREAFRKLSGWHWRDEDDEGFWAFFT
jgi:hypothetical protein